MKNTRKLKYITLIIACCMAVTACSGSDVKPAPKWPEGKERPINLYMDSEVVNEK